MATTAAVSKNLLKNRSLPQILRGQILGRSNNIAKDHLIVQSLIVSNQTIHAQIPIFDFPQRDSLFGSYGGLSLLEKGVVRHGMDDFDIKARGKGVEEEDDDDDSDNEFDDDDDDDEFDGELVDDDDFDDELDDDEDDDDDDDEGKFEGAKYKNKS